MTSESDSGRKSKYEWESRKKFIEKRYAREKCSLQKLLDDLAKLDPPLTPSKRALKIHLKQWGFVKNSRRNPIVQSTSRIAVEQNQISTHNTPHTHTSGHAMLGGVMETEMHVDTDAGQSEGTDPSRSDLKSSDITIKLRLPGPLYLMSPDHLAVIREAYRIAGLFRDDQAWNGEFLGSVVGQPGLPHAAPEQITDGENSVCLDYPKTPNSDSGHIPNDKLKSWLETILDDGGHLFEDHSRRLQGGVATMTKGWATKDILWHFPLVVDLVYRGMISWGPILRKGFKATEQVLSLKNFARVYHKFVLDPELESYGFQGARVFRGLLDSLRRALRRARPGVDVSVWEEAMDSEDFWNKCLLLDPTISKQQMDLRSFWKKFVEIGKELKREGYDYSPGYFATLGRFRRFYDRQFGYFWDKVPAGSVAIGVYLYMWMWVEMEIEKFSLVNPNSGQYVEIVQPWVLRALLGAARNIANITRSAHLRPPATLKTQKFDTTSRRFNWNFNTSPGTLREIQPAIIIDDSARSYLLQFAKIMHVEVMKDKAMVYGGGNAILEMEILKKELDVFLVEEGFWDSVKEEKQQEMSLEH